MSDSLQPHGLYNPWNSPEQNTGVGSFSLLQGNLPSPGIESRSPALRVDSLPTEPQGKPIIYNSLCYLITVVILVHKKSQHLIDRIQKEMLKSITSGRKKKKSTVFNTFSFQYDFKPHSIW